MTTEYRKAYDSAQKELAKLIEQRDVLDSRITKLRQTLSALASLLMEPEQRRKALAEGLERALLENRTLTEDVESVLDSKTPMTAAQVKSALMQLGWTEADTNSAYVILTRLVDSGSVELTETDGKRSYRKKTFGERLMSRSSGKFDALEKALSSKAAKKNKAFYGE